jgi:sulfite reductase beta subunit-like hemoprotein
VGDAPALALAAVRLFDRLGDRENRTRARLRHVRQRLGDEAFRAELDREFVAVKAERRWPALPLAEPAARWTARRALSFLNGDVAADQADVLAHLADDAALSVRIGNDHRVWIFGEDQHRLDRRVQEHAELAATAAPQPIIVACPGTRWCARGLADTTLLAERLRNALSGKLDGQLIGISGCPNGCALSAVSDVGLTGGRSGQEEKYILLSGGGQGRDGRLARAVSTGLSADEVCQHKLLAGPPAGGP